jgi:hypothetical protein
LDGYRASGLVEQIGSLVKFLGVVAALAGVAVGTALDMPDVMRFGVILGSVLLGFVMLVLGVLVSAVSQMMVANIDTAVNTSPLVDDDTRRAMLATRARSTGPAPRSTGPARCPKCAVLIHDGECLCPKPRRAGACD